MGALNGQHVKRVRLEGDKAPWPARGGEDELCLVHERKLDVSLRDAELRLQAADLTHDHVVRIVTVRSFNRLPDGVEG